MLFCLSLLKYYPRSLMKNRCSNTSPFELSPPIYRPKMPALMFDQSSYLDILRYRPQSTYLFFNQLPRRLFSIRLIFSNSYSANSTGPEALLPLPLNSYIDRILRPQPPIRKPIQAFSLWRKPLWRRHPHEHCQIISS